MNDRLQEMLFAPYGVDSLKHAGSQVFDNPVHAERFREAVMKIKRRQ